MIRFVYFDVGGVLIKDFSANGKWLELQNELGIKPEQEKEFIEFYDKYETEVCLGREVDSLIPMMEDKFGIKVPTGYSFLKDGFVKRFEANKFIRPVVEKIQAKCRVGMLTNTYPGMLGAIKERGLLPNANWAAIIDSSIDKVKKPDRQIFELAQKRAGVAAEELLFVENSAKHVKAAAECGWQTFLYDSVYYEEESKRLDSSLIFG
jgi:HAD superfamily hydrolase (TIGR01509 family)